MAESSHLYTGLSYPSPEKGQSSRRLSSPEGKKMEEAMRRVEVVRTQTLAPPPTPKKSARRPLFSMAPPPPKSPFRTASETAKHKNELIIDGKICSLLPLKWGTKYSFMDVYTFADGQKMIYPSYPNANLVVKAFSETHIDTNAESLKELMSRELNDNKKAQDIGLPIATIVNSDTALKDGFILQLKIPNELDIKNPLHLEQAKVFFEESFKQNLLLDLLPSNLRADNEGKIFLIDCAPDDGDTRRTLTFNNLVAWCKLYKESNQSNRSQVESFLNAFTKGLEQYFDQLPQVKQEVLDFLFLFVL